MLLILVCEDANIRHVLRPIEFKEKLAEAYFKDFIRLAALHCGLGAGFLVFGLVASLTPLICRTGVVTRTCRQSQLVRFPAGTRPRCLVLSVLGTFPTTNCTECLAFIGEVTLFCGV